MDIGKAFKYVFEDPNWIKKVIIGGLLCLIPVIGTIFVVGYMLETLKNVAAGEASPLPEWADLGGKFTRGLSLAIALFIYTLPAYIFYCLLFLLARVGEDNRALSLLGSCFGCLAVLYILVFAVLSPAIIIRYAATGEIMSCFQLGKVFGLIKSNIGNYIMALILTCVASFIASFGVILCGVGVLFTYFWAELVYAHLLGQVYRAAGPSVA